MVDDGTSPKLIERIDVDPVRNFDVFMPVIGVEGGDGDFKGVETGNSNFGVTVPHSDEEDNISLVEQLEKNMEQELIKERTPEIHLHETSEETSTTEENTDSAGVKWAPPRALQLGGTIIAVTLFSYF